MKRALEVALLAGLLAMGAFVLRAWRQRRALAVRTPPSPSAAPGEDIENPDGPPSLWLAPRGVSSLPALKETRLPRPSRRPAVVPPPADAAKP